MFLPRLRKSLRSSSLYVFLHHPLCAERPSDISTAALLRWHRRSLRPVDKVQQPSRAKRLHQHLPLHQERQQLLGSQHSQGSLPRCRRRQPRPKQHDPVHDQEIQRRPHQGLRHRQQFRMHDDQRHDGHLPRRHRRRILLLRCRRRLCCR